MTNLSINIITFMLSRNILTVPISPSLNTNNNHRSHNNRNHTSKHSTTLSLIFRRVPLPVAIGTMTMTMTTRRARRRRSFSSRTTVPLTYTLL